MKSANAAAFRAALEAGLNREARLGGRSIGLARKFVAFTRMLARLQAAAATAWVLKGDFALEAGFAAACRYLDPVPVEQAGSP